MKNSKKKNYKNMKNNIKYLSGGCIAGMSSNDSGGLACSYQAQLANVFDPLEVHHRATANAKNLLPSPSIPGSSSRESQRSRSLMEAHKRATTGPKRCGNSFTWTHTWPANTDPKYVNFHHEVYYWVIYFCYTR